MQMQDVKGLAGIGRDLYPGAFEGFDLIFVRPADTPAPLRRVAVLQADADLHGGPPTDPIFLLRGCFLRDGRQRGADEIGDLTPNRERIPCPARSDGETLAPLHR